MSNFLEITSNDNWFKKHPEKIAGVEYETTSFFFPIMVKGTKEDVLRVTGMSSELDKKFENKKALFAKIVANVNLAKEKNITVPVLRYKANGNDLIDTKKTIDAIEGIENAFTIKDNDGGYFLVLKLTNNNKTIYFEEGSYSERSIKEDTTQQLVDKLIERVTNNLKDTETVRHVSKLSLQIAEELGYDYKKLQQIRDTFYKQKSENELIEKQQKEQQKIDRAKTEIENAIKTFTEFAFGNGGIHYDTLEILIKENNLEKPHIRTIGSLRKRNVIFKEQGSSYNYRGTAGYKISTNDPIYNAIEKLKEIYKSNPDKEKRIRIANANAKAKIKILQLQ
jgi:hypothetical protein